MICLLLRFDGCDVNDKDCLYSLEGHAAAVATWHASEKHDDGLSPDAGCSRASTLSNTEPSICVSISPIRELLISFSC